MVTRSNTRTIITELAQEAVSNLQKLHLAPLTICKTRERGGEEEEEKGTH
jgi:hypothetical protein